MHLPGLFQLLVIVLIVLLLFGRGRISDTLGDFGKGVRAFRKGLNTSEQPTALPMEGQAQLVASDTIANPADN